MKGTLFKSLSKSGEQCLGIQLLRDGFVHFQWVECHFPSFTYLNPHPCPMLPNMVPDSLQHFFRTYFLTEALETGEKFASRASRAHVPDLLLPCSHRRAVGDNRFAFRASVSSYVKQDWPYMGTHNRKPR